MIQISYKSTGNLEDIHTFSILMNMLEADSTPLLMDRETFTTGRACHWRRRNSNNPRACLLNLSSFSTFVFILLFPKLVFVLGNPNVHFLFSATNYVCIYNGSLGNMLCYMCYLLSHKSWKLSIPRTEKKKQFGWKDWGWKRKDGLDIIVCEPFNIDSYFGLILE